MCAYRESYISEEDKKSSQKVVGTKESIFIELFAKPNATFCAVMFSISNCTRDEVPCICPHASTEECPVARVYLIQFAKFKERVANNLDPIVSEHGINI